MIVAAQAPRLAFRGLEKRFGARRALAAVTLELPAGTIHGILGENGAGKSTLVRIVAGAVRADAGAVLVDGTPLPPGAPRAARAAGVGVVFQHFALIGALSVAENLFLGRPEAQSAIVTPAALANAATRLAQQHGLAIGDPLARVDTLPVGTQARVEILRALSGPVKVLLLDEPTAVLTPQETAELFTTLRRLRDGGVLVVLITHKLGEALEVCDAVSVMRAGALVTTVAARDLSATALARLMVGDDAADRARALSDDTAGRLDAVATPADPAGSDRDREPLRSAREGTAAMLVLRDVVSPPASARVGLSGVSLTVAAGEICGIAGVDGNGQDELAAAIYGLAPRGGDILVDGRPLPAEDVAAAQRAGIALIPGDRRRDGLAGGLSVWENALLSRPLLAACAPHGLLDVGAAERRAADLAASYRVVYERLEQPVSDLSGGNQQRIVIARALAVTPRVLIAVNPTRGLDLAATAQVHATVAATARGGAAVLLVSTDLDELRALSTHAFVLYRGRLHGPVPSTDRGRLSALMAGVAA